LWTIDVLEDRQVLSQVDHDFVGHKLKTMFDSAILLVVLGEGPGSTSGPICAPPPPLAME
ncbi:hypothetical protein Ancab_038066, partial [Ancistrocladus abbreviatus]